MREAVLSRSGGLLEIYSELDTEGITATFLFVVQVMHQTVFDFVISLRFKDIVLGDLGKTTWENGHLFHLKYLCSSDHKGASSCEDLIEHAKWAEITGGQSHIGFLESLPDEFYRDRWGGRLKSSLGFAASAKLVLCLRDWVQRPNWLDNVHEPLLFHCCAVQPKFDA
jgi:hypothetical protein